MDITLITNNSTFEVEAHASECSRIADLTAKTWEIVSEDDFDTRIEAFMSYNEDLYEEDGKDGCQHIAFKPCTKDLPNGDWPEEFGL